MDEMVHLNLMIEDRHRSVSITATTADGTVDVGEVTGSADGEWASECPLIQVEGENQGLYHESRGRAAGHLVAVWLDRLQP